MTAHLDRALAQRLMAEAGIEALILLSSAAFTHATGAPHGVGTMWRQAGAGARAAAAASGQQGYVPARRPRRSVTLICDLERAG